MSEVIVTTREAIAEILQEIIAPLYAIQVASDVMTLRQMCAYLSTTPPTVQKRIKAGLPVSYALGEKSPRFLKSEINDWLKENKCAK